MRQSKNRQLKVGLLVSAGVLLFIMGVYYLGSKQNLFSSSITVRSYFYDVEGLTEGNKVRFGGINVGTVSEIQIVSDSAIQVKFTIDKDVQEFIKKDSRVEIGQEGIMGNKVIRINPGSANTGSITENGELQSVRTVDFEEILKEARSIIREGRLFATNLKEMSEKMNRGEGDLAKLLNDSSITTSLSQTGKELLAISRQVNQITRKVNEGQGDLGKLLNDTSITYGTVRTLHKLDLISARLDTFAHELLIFGNEINHGNGLIQRMVHDSLMAVKVDTGLVLINNGVREVAAAAKAIRKSWLLNLFQGRNNGKDKTTPAKHRENPKKSAP